MSSRHLLKRLTTSRYHDKYELLYFLINGIFNIKITSWSSLIFYHYLVRIFRVYLGQHTFNIIFLITKIFLIKSEPYSLITDISCYQLSKKATVFTQCVHYRCEHTNPCKNTMQTMKNIAFEKISVHIWTRRKLIAMPTQKQIFCRKKFGR